MIDRSDICVLPQEIGEFVQIFFIGKHGVHGSVLLALQVGEESLDMASGILFGNGAHSVSLCTPVFSKRVFARGWKLRCTCFRCSTATCVYTWVVEISECPRIVCTVRRSAPFSTMCVAHECRSMCGDAWRPDAADAAPTICQMR